MTLRPREIVFDEVWMSLRGTVEQVLKLNNIGRNQWNASFGWEILKFTYSPTGIYLTNLCILYSDVYAICVAFPDPLADRLYSETKNFLENYVKSQLDEFNSYRDPGENEGANQLLYKYYNSWTNYSKGLEYLNYLYL